MNTFRNGRNNLHLSVPVIRGGILRNTIKPAPFQLASGPKRLCAIRDVI